MEDFDIEVTDETAPDYDMADNFAENLVDASRCDIVGNEGPFLALNATYATGLFQDPSEYNMTMVRGKSGEGKSELKGNADKLWPNAWLLRAGSTSDQGLVDDDRWNNRYVGAFAEFQQMQGKMLEMIKSSAGGDADEDGYGFMHTRNTDEGEDGRGSNEIKKKAMPIVFLFADENSKDVPQELQTRMMNVRVESDPDINRAVIDTMFDHQNVNVTGRDAEYQFNFDEGKQAIKNHISSIPRPIQGDYKQYASPVVIPHDESVDWPIVDHPSIDSAGWDVSKVLKPIFNPNEASAKRAAKAVSNHVRAWTLLNYHTRETIEFGEGTHYVAEPQDVSNVLAYRDLLLNMTHGLNEKKFAVIEALTDEHNGVGAPGPNGGFQATHMDIREYIEEYAPITSMSKSQLTNSRNTGVLDQMEEEYLIEVHEGEGSNGAHMYEFLGGSTFGHPNIDIYADLFEPCTDPISGDPITETVADFEESLSTKSAEDLLSSDPMDAVTGGASETSSESTSEDPGGDLSDFSEGDDGDEVEYDEIDSAVHERLRDTLDDHRVTPQDMASISNTEHMLGITPVETYTDDRGLRYIRAERAPEDGDKTGTIMDISHHTWGDMSPGQVESRIENSIAKLKSSGVFVIDEEPDSDDKYLMVKDLES